MYEDLLTEIFAELFSNKNLLLDFTKCFLGVTLYNPQNIRINTQKTFLGLDEHETNSRPDLVIEFKDNEQKYTFFFENKLESSEGNLQLQRYAEHLKSYKDEGDLTFLFYITCYDDPKKEEEIFVNGVTAKFIQLRWYKIYNWLRNWKDPYICKVLGYMEEIGLNESRRFLPQDIYALQEMNRLQNMMDECLDGTVDEVMTKLFGKAISWSNRNVQLRDHDRYFKMNEQTGNRFTWIGCGFYITEEEYPLVCVTYEVSPSYQRRREVIKAMKDFISNNTQWQGYELDNDSEWSGISCDRSLLDFLKDEDHITSIQKYFMDKLKELHKLKEHYPNLGWKKV